jgi:DNA-binding response OmpR family regulator
MPKPHVLVVDDHAPLREQIVALLPKAGLRVREAADLRLALRTLVVEPRDLPLLDVGLPGLGGVSLCE